MWQKIDIRLQLNLYIIYHFSCTIHSNTTPVVEKTMTDFVTHSCVDEVIQLWMGRPSELETKTSDKNITRGSFATLASPAHEYSLENFPIVYLWSPRRQAQRDISLRNSWFLTWPRYGVHYASFCFKNLSLFHHPLLFNSNFSPAQNHQPYETIIRGGGAQHLIQFYVVTKAIDEENQKGKTNQSKLWKEYRYIQKLTKIHFSERCSLECAFLSQISATKHITNIF